MTTQPTNQPASRVEIGTVAGQWAALGRRGWVYWHHPEVDSDVRLRLRRSDDGWSVGTVWIDAEPSAGVPTKALRLLTFGPVEALARDPELAQLVGTDSTSLPELDPSVCPSGEALRRTEGLPLREKRTLLAKVEIPPATERDDHWYMTFELRYVALAKQSRSPAKDIAEASGVKVTTVHALYREAKRRRRARDELWEQGRAERDQREARLTEGLRKLGYDSFEEYYDEFGYTRTPDPLQVWDEGGSVVGPPPDLDLDEVRRPDGSDGGTPSTQ